MNHIDIMARIIIAIFVGGCIGLEREMKKKPAGFITHTLVCLGACVIATIQMLIVEKGFEIALTRPELISTVRSDMGRLSAQVISGIGFLGAGTIIQTKDAVTGITTAATLWLVACLGLAVGMGYFFLAIASLIAVIFVLKIMKPVEQLTVKRKKFIKLVIDFKGEEDIEYLIEEYLKTKNAKIHSIKHLKEKYIDDFIEKKILYTILVPKDMKAKDVLEDIKLYEEIINIYLV